MVCFLVPVKSKKLSADWDKFSELVNRTLKSINGQKNRDFQIVVSCHELPEKKYEHPQVHYLQVDFDIPALTHTDREKDRQLKEGDKANKILSAYEYGCNNFDVDYFMVVDSDDCVHNGITEFVNAKLNSNIAGWYFNKGYYYREGKKYAFLNRHTFNTLCGSCIIIKKELFKQLVVKEPFLYYFHETTVLADKQALTPFPKAGAIYSMANGENHHMSTATIKNLVNRPKMFTLGHIQSLWGKIMKIQAAIYGPKLQKNV